MTFPRKITPCPIVESNVEIQFETDIPLDAVFGVIYNQFQSEYEKVDKLPILQLPEYVRTVDPNLKYKPYYKLTKGNIVFMIGPKVINIGCINSYAGWATFSKVINSHLMRVIETKALKKITRYGIRYINFFEHGLSGKIKLEVATGAFPFALKDPYIKTYVENNKFTVLLQIANQATIIKESKRKAGSIIDLDVSLSSTKNDIIPNIDSIVQDSHNVEKEIFFSILKEEFLATLNPE